MSNASLTKQLSFLDRYLTLWIFVAMGIGVLLSITMANIGEALEFMSIGTKSGPIAIGLIVMMYPPLVKVNMRKCGVCLRIGKFFYCHFSKTGYWVRS